MDTSKDLPVELRFPSSVASARTHQDLDVPVAGPSRFLSASFRDDNPAGYQLAGTGDSEFEDFASQRLSVRPWSSSNGKARLRSAADIAASSWSADDLLPNPDDGAAVLRLLSQPSTSDDLVEGLSELSSRRSQTWQTLSDDPPRSNPLYSMEQSPYLYEALDQQDGQTLVDYLRTHQYTDDVWSLPLTLQGDLEAIRQTETDSAVQTRALRRLQLLKRHLQSPQPPRAESFSSDASTLTTAGFSEEDWNAIWLQAAM